MFLLDQRSADPSWGPNLATSLLLYIKFYRQTAILTYSVWLLLLCKGSWVVVIGAVRTAKPNLSGCLQKEKLPAPGLDSRNTGCLGCYQGLAYSLCFLNDSPLTE